MALFVKSSQDGNGVDVAHMNLFSTLFIHSQTTSSIGHPPHSSASPVESRLRLGPRTLMEKINNLRNKGVKNFLSLSCLSVCNARTYRSTFFHHFFIANFCLFCQKGKSSVLTALPFFSAFLVAPLSTY